MHSKPAPVIYINGYPGSGKLTIALAMQALIPNSKVLDNHSLIDPVEKLCPRGTAYYNSERGEYRRAMLKPIGEDPALRDVVFFFTDCQTGHNECMGDYTQLITEDRRFYSIIIECDVEENVKRLESPGRGGDANGKMTDGEALREMRARGGGVFEFRDDDELKIDVTSLTATEAAGEIVAWFERREPESVIYVDF